MRIGDTIESAAWLTGAESKDVLLAYKDRVREAVNTLCREKGFLPGPVAFTEKKPGEDRVPEVPEHLQGPNVRLLIGEADVLCKAPETGTRGFVGELELKDLLRLRAITRRAYAKEVPGGTMTDQECDDWIEELGPEAALGALRRAVDRGYVH